MQEAKARQREIGKSGKIVEDSADSDKVTRALNQAELLEKGVIGLTMEQKYVKRKQEAADRLLKEKERAIQE